MRQIAIFIAVGTTAVATHLAVAAAVVELGGLPPLAANVIGFCIAFFVSFAGHSRWTFPLAPGQLGAARTRFFAVALTGFILNQTAYAGALHIFGPAYYLPILGAVLIGVAVSTFLLSKLWAFAQPLA
jgi:putative flippase GtrA